MSDKFYEKLNQFVVLAKAKEDLSVHPDSRREYRKQRNIHGGVDALSGQSTTAPGVSDAGIEARRGDSRITPEKVIAHGYGRSTSPDKHKQLAQDIHRSLLHSLKQQPKANLPKSEQEVSMPKKDFVQEHKNLVHVLEEGSKAERTAEAKEQSQELKEQMQKKAKLPVGPDVVSGPQLDNDIKFINSRAQVSGPTMLNVRDKIKKALDLTYGGQKIQKAKIDEGKTKEEKIKARTERGTHYLLPEVHLTGVHSNRMGRDKTTSKPAAQAVLSQLKRQPKPNLPKSEDMQKTTNPMEQPFHIHDVSGGQNLRITSKPMKLQDIHLRYGKNIEQKGFRLIPHNAEAVQADPKQPQRK